MKDKQNFNENEIRPNDLMELKKPALEWDKAYLRNRISEFVKVRCVACGSNNIRFWSEKEGFSYDICQACETIFMNPRGTEEIISDFYKQSKNYEFWNKYIFPATNESRKEKIFRTRLEKTLEYCKRFNSGYENFLEVGAGYGTFCELMVESKKFKNVIALEPTPDLAATLRGKGITTYEETIEEFSYQKESFDVVATFEVIEHLVNPQKFMEKIVGFLKKDGLFICTCPNGKSLLSMLLKEKASFIDHEHLNYFNPDSLSGLLNRFGVEILEVITPGKLDADLLYNRLEDLNPDIADHTLVKYLFNENWDNCKDSLQEFIVNTKLSSHLWIVGKKIK